jgi:hypothetical protein
MASRPKGTPPPTVVYLSTFYIGSLDGHLRVLAEWCGQPAAVLLVKS